MRTQAQKVLKPWEPVIIKRKLYDSAQHHLIRPNISQSGPMSLNPATYHTISPNINQSVQISPNPVQYHQIWPNAAQSSPAAPNLNIYRPIWPNNTQSAPKSLNLARPILHSPPQNRQIERFEIIDSQQKQTSYYYILRVRNTKMVNRLVHCSSKWWTDLGQLKLWFYQLADHKCIFCVLYLSRAIKSCGEPNQQTK